MCRVSRERGRGQLVRRARFWRTLVWVVVPQVGLEPTTHGYALTFRHISLLATLAILDILTCLPALSCMPALPALPAKPASPLLPAANAGSCHFRVGGNVEDHEHSPSSCLGTADASDVGGAR